MRDMIDFTEVSVTPYIWYLVVGFIFACFVLVRERPEALAEAFGALLEELFITVMLTVAWPLCIAARIYNTWRAKRKKSKSDERHTEQLKRLCEIEERRARAGE